MVPFCDLCVCENGVVAAGDAGGEAARYVVVGWVVAFCVAGGVVFVLPVAVLGCEKVLEECRKGRKACDERSLNVYHIGTYSSYRLITKVA